MPPHADAVFYLALNNAVTGYTTVQGYTVQRMRNAHNDSGHLCALAQSCSRSRRHIREGAGPRMCLGKRRLHSLAIHTVAVMLTVRQVAPW